MAGILRGGRRTRQSPSAQSINTGNPLARGLVFAFDGNNWRDAVTGAVATPSGTPTRISTPRGIATYFSGSAYLSFASKESWNVTGPITILWLGSLDATTGTDRTLVSKTDSNGTANTPFEFHINSGAGVPRLFRASGAAYAAQDLSASNVGVGYHSIFFADDANPGDAGTGYVDGSAYASFIGGSATSVTGTAQPLQLGRRVDGVAQLTGSVNGCFIWNRRLSVEEYWLLRANPWQLFAPSRKASRFGTSAAGGAAALAGSLAASGTVSGALSTAIQAAASVSASASVTAALSTGIRPGASVSASATVSAALTTSIQMAGSLSATASVTGDISGAAALASTVSTSAIVTGALTTAIQLNASLSGAATVAGTLTDVAAANFAASISGSATVTASLTGGSSSIWTPATPAAGVWTPI